MNTGERKKHWDSLYGSRKTDEVSWYQPAPTVTLNFLNETGLPKSAKILDIGGGDSLLADHLLGLGYENISVLDISKAALDKAKKRLGGHADRIKWIHADVTSFEPLERYDFWHDRATFHFLTVELDIAAYRESVLKAVKDQGILLIGTFSTDGPDKCSGLRVKQYSEITLDQCFSENFVKTECFHHDHRTPSGEVQNFVFCSFRKSEKND